MSIICTVRARSRTVFIIRGVGTGGGTGYMYPPLTTKGGHHMHLYKVFGNICDLNSRAAVWRDHLRLFIAEIS